MSSRVFQSVIVQMKEATERCIGVVDEQGFVIACSELSMIGSHLDDLQAALADNPEQIFTSAVRTYKLLGVTGSRFDYAVFVAGHDAAARSICILASVAMNEARTNYEEKHNKATFVKNIISDNILPGDVYVRAKELHFVTDVPRSVYLVRQLDRSDVAALEVIQNLFPDRQRDFVLSVSETDIVVIKELTREERPEDIVAVAENIENAVRSELLVKTVIGIGTTATTCASWPTGIRKPRSPSRSARSSTLRSPSSTTRISALAASSTSCRPPCARCSSPRSSRRTPSRPWIRTRWRR